MLSRVAPFDGCSDTSSCAPNDARYTAISGLSCLATRCARSWQCGDSTVQQTAWTHRPTIGRTNRLSQACHNRVRILCATGDRLRRSILVRLVRDQLRDSEIQPLSDWGSSGRRFKSCQPDTVSPTLSAGVPESPKRFQSGQYHNAVLNEIPATPREQTTGQGCRSGRRQRPWWRRRTCDRRCRT